jgi:hypothetical protein
MKNLVEKISAFGWENCYRLTSGGAEMIATADVGPRIVFFGQQGGKNLLKLFEHQTGRSGDSDWLVYGGHRLWAAPEDPVLSYIPDNEKVELLEDPESGFLTFVRQSDQSGLERRMGLRALENDEIFSLASVDRLANSFSSESDFSGFSLKGLGENNPLTMDKGKMKDGIIGAFIVRNEIVNRSNMVIKTASWGISSFIDGGVGYMPLQFNQDQGKELQAGLSVNLWQYCSLADPSYQWKEKHLEIDQKKVQSKQKVGIWSPEPWLAYQLDQLQILIESKADAGERLNFPDMGSNIEIYWDEDMLELETLSPWKNLQPGESVWHDEVWTLIN